MTRIALAWTIVAVTGSSLLAQTRPVDPAALAVRQIDQQLKMDNKAAHAAAVQQITKLLDEQPQVLAQGFSSWVRPLADLKEYALIDRAAPVAILGKPQTVPALADIQAARVEALLGLAQYERALSEAKSYYNVATLKQTEVAIDLFAMALDRARGREQPGIGTRFRKQQLDGATIPPAVQADAVPAFYAASATSAGSGEILLKSVKVDASVYEGALAKLKDADSYPDLMNKGNLLLLADRPNEAKACFRKASERETTRGKDLMAALEGVARAIRAEDGSVGRANGFINALRDQK